MWYPNRENSVLLKCGCIDIPWGAVRFIGGGSAEYLSCKLTGEQQKILRKAKLTDYNKPHKPIQLSLETGEQ